MNQLASNPWIIDTPSDTVIYPNNLYHGQIEYVDYTDPTHSVEVQNRDGRIVARLQGTPDLRTVRTGRMGWVTGLKVPLLDSDAKVNLQSGKVILYFE